ncbi:MAG: DUF4405 domain-containing protein [Caldimicrobium sp.]|nr:DUF4405 domain-containing protein [Caldimicrobium sp.]MCX7613185.1 DUF4405 domain-containing protein [Caldimicrobium sp.]MDW8182513.1 DUF4405 domain-containing protein [Caldimicrobium sp.]
MPRLNLRGFISISTGFTFALSLVSGIVLFFTPQGRIAYWIDWEFLWLNKTEWTNWHILSSIFFLLFGSLHLYQNFKAFLQHLYKRAKHLKILPTETLVSSALCLFLIVSALLNLPPLSYIIKLSENLKKSWVRSPDYEPPVPHAETLSLKAFCLRQKIDIELALNTLKDHGVSVKGPEETLKDIAKRNKISPAKIYQIIKPLEPKEKAKIEQLSIEELETQLAGKGVGRKNLRALSQELGFDYEKAKENLKRRGYTFEESETMRDIASRYQKRPIEVLKEALEP